MKLLHTSDWHLGHTLYNYDRQYEQQCMLNQIVDIVRSEHPDVFLLCGDVYHTAQPSAAVQRMFADTMSAIHEACPEMNIFVIAGNHDSASKHDIFTTPWRALNVTTAGSVNTDMPDSMIHKADEKCFVIAVPYCHERNMPEHLFKNLLERTKQLNCQNLPVIMCAHTSVSGCDFKGHDPEGETTIGGIDTMDIDEFGDGYDYLALGHIHRPQTLGGSKGLARYSGTPLPVSFDEDYAHSITIVEIEGNGCDPTIREIIIDNPLPLVTLPSDGSAPFDKVLLMLESFPDDIDAYIRLNVEIQEFLPHLAREEAIAASATKKCRFCHINITRTNSDTGSASASRMSIGEFKRLTPLEVAELFTTEKGIFMDSELKQLLKETYVSVIEDERK